MKISRRIAEYYALNMKKKLRCYNKREMIYLLADTGIVHQLEEVIDVKYLFIADQDLSRENIQN